MNKRRGGKGVLPEEERWVRKKPEDEEEGSGSEEGSSENESAEETDKLKDPSISDNKADKESGPEEDKEKDATKTATPKPQAAPTRKPLPESSSEEEHSDEEDDGTPGWKSKSNKPAKAKGVEELIEIENPNRHQKQHLKASEVANVKTELTRKEKEVIEKQKATQARVEKSDLARLVEIRKQREEAAKRREEEKDAKEAKAKETAKAAGKRT